MRRTVAGGRVFYVVPRVAWGAVGFALAVRLSLAIVGAVAGTIAIGQGWINW